jgi:hypothetical protein
VRTGWWPTDSRVTGEMAQVLNDTAWHTVQVIKATRGLLAAEGTIEEALDAVMLAARHEFGCTVIVTTPARLRIDGHDWSWPEANGHA